MKMLFLLAVIGAALIQAQPARIIPGPMMPLRILEGEWHTSGGWIDFRFSPDNTRMTCRTAPDKSPGRWHEMMTFRLENGEVVVNGYRLVSSAPGELRFTDNSKPVRTMTYKKLSTDRISYRFETGGRVTDSGILDRNVRLLPLTE